MVWPHYMLVALRRFVRRVDRTRLITRLDAIRHV